MARGPRPTTPPTAPSLPQVEFEIIKHKTERYGVNDSHARSYGCRFPAGFELVEAHLFLPQSTIGARILCALIIIFDTSVCVFTLDELVNRSQWSIEPLESDLARQVEYDMDEQGTRQSLQPRPPIFTS